MERMIGHKAGTKIQLLMEFNNKLKSVKDSWYYDCYNETYHDIITGCTSFLNCLEKIIYRSYNKKTL